MKAIKARQSSSQIKSPSTPVPSISSQQAGRACASDHLQSEARFYRTYAGHLKQSDEPDEEEQYRQAERIHQTLMAQRQKASRQRLKNKDIEPTKNGKKLFREFMKEANRCKSNQIQNQQAPNLTDVDVVRMLYQSASSLGFDEWSALLLGKRQ